MDFKTTARLRKLNREFYSRVGPEFHSTRNRPWPGWVRLLEVLHDSLCVPGARVLDVGCGNARFARFLRERMPPSAAFEYQGVDSDPFLIEVARAALEASGVRFELRQRDVLESPLAQKEWGEFNVVVAFGLLHHVPGRKERQALTRDLAAQLAGSGRLVVSLWRFGKDPRSTDRILPRSAFEDRLIDLADLEPGDALLSFGGQETPRYCHDFDDLERIELLRAPSGLRPERTLEAFCDSTDANDYLVWCRNAAEPGKAPAGSCARGIE